MRNRLLGVLAAGTLLGLAGCASNNKQTQTTTDTTAQAPENASELEQQISQAATGSQVGKITAISTDELTLDPYEPSAGEAILALEAQTPVFEPDGQTSMDPQAALETGDDVRVYYQARDGQAPLVLGVVELSEQEAEQLASQYGASEQSAAERFAEADGVQSGTVAQLSEDEMVLDPYEEAAGDAALALPEDVVVVRDGVEVGRDALSEGSNVRVFFDLQQGAEPQVVGIEILNADQAEELQQQEQQ